MGDGGSCSARALGPLEWMLTLLTHCFAYEYPGNTLDLGGTDEPRSVSPGKPTRLLPETPESH